MWARDQTMEQVIEETGLAYSTVQRYYEHFRQLSGSKLEEELTANKFHDAVEIDESQFGKRKYNRGRMNRTDWVFGICDKTPGGRVYMTCVERRDRATLLPIIAKYVDHDARVYSDEWAPYNALNRQGRFHLSVCHKHNFVDPETLADTQRIESLWASCKSWLRARHYRCQAFRNEYVAEWCWRYNHQKDWHNIWVSILNQISYSLLVFFPYDSENALSPRPY
jgi:transposase-like protein